MPSPRLVIAPPKYKRGDLLVALTFAQVEALHHASKQAAHRTPLGAACRRLADSQYRSRG